MSVDAETERDPDLDRLSQQCGTMVAGHKAESG
jgi:hypothetical protein